MILKAAALLFTLTGAALAQPVPEPEGFRNEPYLAPVPATLAGAQVIDAAQAMALHEQGVPFLDALPRRPPRPDKLPKGTIWMTKAHRTIPGAVWIYDTGYDRIPPKDEVRLSDALKQATHGDMTAPVVIFCKANCWMSWNAAKRAVAMGYQGVRWFPEGVDGWVAAGGSLTDAR